VSIVGAEEIYPMIGNIKPLARALGFPYFPVTPTFPLLGPLGMVPLPSKWIIEFGEPIPTTGFGDSAADDPMVVFNITDRVRETIQQTLYRLLLRRPDLESFDLSSLRRCVSAAEPLPGTVVREWLARTGLEILDGLGTTELAHIFISARAGSVRPGVIGDVVAGYDARIVGDDSRELPSGVPGLLAVRGPTGARYWRDPDAQAAAVREGWTLTGDVCTRGADGSFVHIRRVDDLIVSGGYKISIGEVERALLDHPDVTVARVFAVGDPVRGAVPHATVTLRPGADPMGASERLQQYLKQELAPYKCPKAIEVRLESLD